jgi:hypothetical protein
MYIRSRKCARKYSERFDHAPEIPIEQIDPRFILQNPSRASLSGSVVPGTKWSGGSSVQSEAWGIQDPEVLYWNPIIGGLESQAELIRVASVCTYILPDVRGPSTPFGAKKMNSMIWKSLTVYVSSGGLKFGDQEPGS